MSDFENLTFPHIRYIPGPEEQKDKIGLFYMGGEPDENSILIIGKRYDISNHWFAPNRETKREYVWCVKQDGKWYNVDPKNFGTIADLRERRINQILE
jgi:hypothetical protein